MVLVIVVVVFEPAVVEPAPTQTFTEDEPILEPCEDPDDDEQASALGASKNKAVVAKRKLAKASIEEFRIDMS